MNHLLKKKLKNLRALIGGQITAQDLPFSHKISKMNIALLSCIEEGFSVIHRTLLGRRVDPR